MGGSQPQETGSAEPAGPLDAQQTQQMAAELPAWTLTGETLEREFKFKNFREALAFVNTMAEIAEAAKHHPDIAISYNRVRLALTTHSAGGLTGKDFVMARLIDVLVA
jgi:4a-hydroxytetrahydrobiopterin dehydratase